jgi:hypothetical protein
MEVSNVTFRQIFHLEKQPRYPLSRRLGWLQSQSGLFLERGNYLLRLPGFEPNVERVFYKYVDLFCSSPSQSSPESCSPSRVSQNKLNELTKLQKITGD